MNKSKNLVTKSGLKKLKDELEYLLTTIRHKIAEDIQIAKQFGDLSENASYQSALEARDLNESRIAELEEMINSAKLVVNDKNNADGLVSIGDTVIVKKDDNKEFTVEMVGVGEGDPLKGMLAYDTPLAQAILGKKVGSTVTADLPSGKVVVKIVKIK